MQKSRLQEYCDMHKKDRGLLIVVVYLPTYVDTLVVPTYLTCDAN